MLSTQMMILIAVIMIAVIAVGVLMYQKDNFDISVDPLLGEPYNKRESNCGDSYTEGIGGQYGMTPEFDNNLSVCDFVQKFDKGKTFDTYAENTSPLLMYNQTGYDVPARQICEVLYQGHQRYFENMWSGLGECELYFTEKAKSCKDIKVEVI